MARLIENNEVEGIQLKEGQIVLDIDGNEYLIEKGDVIRVVESGLDIENEINAALNINRVKGVAVDFKDIGYILTFPKDVKHSIDAVKEDLTLMLGRQYSINDYGNTVVILEK